MVQERVKTVAETSDMLGISRATVYNLLRNGELCRGLGSKTGGKGRPVTVITLSSIVNYIKTH